MNMSKIRSTTTVPTAKPGRRFSLRAQIERLDQLADAAGEEGADREADDVGRHEVPEAHVELLGGDEDLPAQGSGDELGCHQGDDQ